MLYFLAIVVPESPPELAIDLILALCFFNDGKIMALVKLPAPIMPTTPFVDVKLFVETEMLRAGSMPSFSG